MNQLTIIELLNTHQHSLESAHDALSNRAKRLAAEAIKAQHDVVVAQLLRGECTGYVTTPELLPLISALGHLRRAIDEVKHSIGCLKHVDEESPI